jgi:hypothetical protein
MSIDLAIAPVIRVFASSIRNSGMYLRSDANRRGAPRSDRRAAYY